jgi:8-oxo-dGTP pyrophosphatase MutT (NUDIX family)
MDEFPWKQTSSKIVYQNPWIQVREDEVVRPDGTPGIYSVVMIAPSVYVVAVTEKNEVYLVGQHRYPTHVYSWELPCGGSDHQDVLTAAKRELAEETGLEATEWTNLGPVQSVSGVSDEMQYTFIAKGLTQTGQNKQAEEGITSMKAVPFNELLAMIARGEFTDGQSMSSLMKAAAALGWITSTL